MFDLLDLIWKLLSQIIIGVRIIRWFGLMDELRYLKFSRHDMFHAQIYNTLQQFPLQDICRAEMYTSNFHIMT